MGRHRTNPSRGFFMYNVDENKNTCIICNMDMKGNHASNLERHLKRHHNDEFVTLQNKKIKLMVKQEPNQTIQDFNIPVQHEYIQVKLNQETITKACIEMIILNGCSFELFECSGFKKILNPILDAIGNKFLLSIDNIKLILSERVSEIVYKISKILEGRMISLTVSKYNKYILRINAHCIINGRINVYTLGITELKNKPSGMYIKNVIEEVLLKYNIDIQQVYSITTNSDMLDVVELLKSEENHKISVKKIKCSSRVWQDTLKNAFKQPAVHHLIMEARELVKKTKTKDFNVKKLNLDCDSDWISTYDMLKSLLDFKAFLTDFPESKWRKIQSITHVLQPLTESFFKLQNDQLTLSDFYGIWIESKIKLQNFDNFFAGVLYDEMSNREETLLENEVLLSAVYLDPRFQILLTPQQKVIAVEHLKSIWNKLEKKVEDDERFSMESGDIKPEEDVDDLEFFLRNKELAIKKQNPQSTVIDIECIIHRFGNVKRLDRRKSVLEFWFENKNTFPHLYSVAMIVLSSPPTEIAAGNLFSGFKPLRENRKGFSETLAEDFLLIRNNFNLL